MYDKNLYDIIFLNDKELGIDSGKTNERPAVIIGINTLDGGGWVVPLSSQYRPNDFNRSQYRLATGSFIDLSDEPVFITEQQMTYSRLSNQQISEEDIDELEFRYQSYYGE